MSDYIETLFAKSTTEMPSGWSLAQIRVRTRKSVWLIEWWILNPDGDKVAVFVGIENEAIALAALAGIENHYNETGQ